MAVYYLDTSALLKRYRTEKGTDVVDALYESHPPLNLLTSHFSCLEVESVAARTLAPRSMMGAIANQAYSMLLGSFARDLREYLKLQPLDGETLNYSIEIARRTRLRPADSIQLAAALMAGDRNQGEKIVLVSSDKELLEAAEGAGVETLDPEANDAMQFLKDLKELK